MSANDSIQGSTPPQSSYELVLKRFTQSFDEDSIRTEQLRAPPLEPSSALPRRAPLPSAQSPVEGDEDPVAGASPARSTSSASSGLTYIEVDPDVGSLAQAHAHARAASHSASTRPSATISSQHNTTFEPILPEELTSRQPTPRPSRASHATTIPSPFLAATDTVSNRYDIATLSPAAAIARNQAEFGGASAYGYRSESPHERASSSLEPPVLNLDETLDALRARDRLELVEQTDKAKEVRGPGAQVDEWTRRFLEADRKLKEHKQHKVARAQIEKVKQFEGGEPAARVRGDLDGEFDERDEALSDSSRPGPNQSSRRSSTSSHTSSRLDSTSSIETSSPPDRTKSKSRPKSRSKRPPATTSQKRKRNKRRSSVSSSKREDDESLSGSDRNMTTEKSVALLPKWNPGKNVRNRARRAQGHLGIYSDIIEESDVEHDGDDDDEDEDDDDEETDYDE